MPGAPRRRTYPVDRLSEARPRQRSRREQQPFSPGMGRGAFDEFSAAPLSDGVDGAIPEAAVLTDGGGDSPAAPVAPVTPSVRGAAATATDASVSGSGAGAGKHGYDARFESPLDKKYVCPVCLAALRDPFQTKCGHRFCRACLLRASGFRSDRVTKCPLDKIEFDVRNEVFEDVAMRREVLSLRVLCSNTDHGCEWNGELRSLEDHTASCPHAMILCTNGCQAHHKRVETEEHHLECPCRMVECPACHRRILFKLLKQHQQLLCPRHRIECRLCGKPDIMREDMPKHTNHKDGDCPKSMVPCMYGEVGCNAQVSRCDMPLHVQESQGTHIELLLADHTHKVKLLEEQGALLSQLQERHDQQACRVAALQSKVDEMGEKLDRLRHEISLAHSVNHTGQLHWKVQIRSRDFTAPLLSPPFYTSNVGYKLRLCLELRGHVTRSDSYASVFILLCSGEHDAGLYFPFSATCELTLFDQGGGENHATTHITCQKVPRPQQIESHMQRRGRLQFMKTDTLVNGRFCKAGTLFFHARVTTARPHITGSPLAAS